MKRETIKTTTGWLQILTLTTHVFSSVVLALLLFPSFVFTSTSDDVIQVIEVEGLTRIREPELIRLVGIHAGDILDRHKLSSGVRRAMKKGLFHDITVVSEPYGEGIRLKYLVHEILIIEKIAVHGNSVVSARKIKNSFIYKEGENFIDEFLYRGIDELSRYYHRRGFPDAVVSVVVEDERIPGRVTIDIEVVEGNPEIIDKINVSSHVKGYLKLSEGDIFNREEVEKGIKRVRNYYRKNNYINPAIGPYEYVDGELVIPILPGPRLKVSFKGNSAVRTRELLKELPFLKDEEITDPLIEKAAERVRQKYRSKGYRQAEVAAAVSTEEEVINLNFFIFEGKKMYFREIGFSGNTISPDVLTSILSIREGKPFNAELLNGSRESLVRFYNALGFLNMDINEIKEVFHDDGVGIDIEFMIREERQVIIGDIEVAGNRMIETEVIRSVAGIDEGDPYNVIDIGDARYRVQALYHRFGYLDAGIEVRSLLDSDDAIITFVINENKPSVVGKVIVRGNLKTREKIIQREFTLEDGDAYDYEEVLRIKQKLYKLGLFREVSIAILEPDLSEDDVRLTRDMLVTVKESKAGSVEVGIGYADYEKLRGSIEIGYRNIGGYNRQVGLRAEKNSVFEKYELYYKEPWLFDRPGLPVDAYLKKEKKEAINLDTQDLLYKIDKFSFFAGIEIELSRNLKAGLNYEYSINETTEVDPGVILSKEDTGTLGIGSVSPSLFRDTRDNPFEPTSGSLNGIFLKFASRLFLSESEFVKGTFKSSWYFLLKKGVVFAVSFKGGLAHAFGDTEELPLIERFFLGGRTTVRGYSNDLLGPKGDGDVPTGGNVFALLNNEIRFSVKKNIGVVVFLDGGNVWQVIDDIETDLKYTVGAGLRYSTPVGPARIDYGHKLNRERGESSGRIPLQFRPCVLI